MKTKLFATTIVTATIAFIIITIAWAKGLKLSDKYVELHSH